MNWLNREQFENMPWAGTCTGYFTKPSYDAIERLVAVSLGDRAEQYSEFYELDTYLRLASKLKPGSVLDAGAGCGSLSYLFSLLGWETIAIDFDEKAFRSKKGKFITSNLNDRFPFQSGTFDLVVCKQVIEHLENPNHVIREVNRVLKKGGVFILSTPNISSLSGRLVFFLSGYPSYFENYWKDHRTIPHYGQLKSMLEEYGFEEIEYHTNRYELFSLSAEANGKRRRFIGPLMKLLCRDASPEECKYGQLIILRAVKAK